jgi:hypothetical protein
MFAVFTDYYITKPRESAPLRIESPRMLPKSLEGSDDMLRMDVRSRELYPKALLGHYLRARRRGKSTILDEYCRTTGMARKSVLRKVRGLARSEARPRKKRVPVYGRAERLARYKELYPSLKEFHWMKEQLMMPPWSNGAGLCSAGALTSSTSSTTGPPTPIPRVSTLKSR